MSPYSPSLDELRQQVDSDIASFLAEARSTLVDAPSLVDEISRIVSLGGKRLRPAFCYWGYRAANGQKPEAIIRVGAALELLHTFALVHDDMMDDSSLRRGEPSTHAAFDSDFALLVGDLALVLADAAFHSSDFPADLRDRAFDAYSRMRQEVIAGQFLDYEIARSGTATEEEVRRIAVLKSGMYSVVEPLTIGAALAGATDESCAGLRRFGTPLGEAFQLRDDLLGLFGDASTGKPVDSDVREGKKNLLYVRALAALEGPDRDRFRARWGAAGLAEEEVRLLTELVERCGARASVEGLLAELTEQAGSALANIELPEEARAALSDLTIAATQRHR